jgi:predicted dehydrogenase
MNIAIIGTGSIAEAHAKAIQEIQDAELCAVVSRSKDKGTAFLESQGVSNGEVYSSASELADGPSIQLVIIGSPDGLHFGQTKVCLEAGKHVLIEKPMTLEVTEAEALAKIAIATPKQNPT